MTVGGARTGGKGRRRISTVFQTRPWLFPFQFSFQLFTLFSFPLFTFLHQHARPDHERTHAAGLPGQPPGSCLEEPGGVAVPPQVQGPVRRRMRPGVAGLERLFPARQRGRREVLELVVVVVRLVGVVSVVIAVDGEEEGGARRGGRRRRALHVLFAFL